MSQKLVSIITPCYNGEDYIHKLLDSVLNQTYSEIEMIVVDDGSTDKSADIIKSYIPKFAKKKFELRYIHQENLGQSSAINKALKLIKGDYLVWPDADDYYATVNAIERMVDVLGKSSDDTSMVRVFYNLLDQKGAKLGVLQSDEVSRYKERLFEDCLFEYGKSFWAVAGGYMAKVSKIDKYIPGREIYTEKNAGQNYQLALPLLYQDKCVTLEEFLYNLVYHEDSHSRNLATGNDRQKVYYRTIKHTLNTLPMNEGYKRDVMCRVNQMIENNTVQARKRPYRTYFKKIIKGILPHGFMVLYKRKF